MRKLFIAQIVLVIILACAWGIIDRKMIPSVLYGGAACILPNIYFAYRFFSRRHTKKPGQILISFYLGELMKMIISAAVIILAVIYAHAWILPTVTGYFVANLAFWFAPTLVLKQQARSTP